MRGPKAASSPSPSEERLVSSAPATAASLQQQASSSSSSSLPRCPPPNSADATPLPMWWLAFLPLYWVPQNIGANLIQTYVIPFQVEAVAGDTHKHVAYSLMMISKQIGSCFAPVWGAVSDKLVAADGRQCRRWMVVIGMLLWSADTALMGVSHSFSLLMVSYLLYTATATVSGAPYVTVYQTVPTRQRGKLVAFDRIENFLVRLIANGFAVLLGEKLMSRAAAYAVAVILLPLSIPFGLVGLGERPGLWSQEPMAAVKSECVSTAQPLKSEPHSLCARGSALVKDFLSAASYPPFLWLFITSMCNSTYSTVQNLYFI
eukprot:SAG31_NODE_227_length_19818_cov_6.503271_5_plen_318_part_00